MARSDLCVAFGEAFLRPIFAGPAQPWTEAGYLRTLWQSPLTLHVAERATGYYGLRCLPTLPRGDWKEDVAGCGLRGVIPGVRRGALARGIGIV